jgi:hypothetical protein
MTIEEYGVKTPTHRLMATLAHRTSVQGEFTSVQCAVPSFRNVAATTNRSRRSAMPGSPVGNIENSLCTIERVICPGETANLQSRVAELFFRREIHTPRLPYSYVRKRQTSWVPWRREHQTPRFLALNASLAFQLLHCQFGSDILGDRRLRRTYSVWRSVDHGLRRFDCFRIPRGTRR